MTSSAERVAGTELVAPDAADENGPTPGHATPSVHDRGTLPWKRRLVMAGLPAVVYLACRAVGMLVLWAMATAHGARINVFVWDGAWYRAIAEHGYRIADIIQPNLHPVRFASQAFFPGFPWLLRAATWLTGGNDDVAVVLLNTAAGVVFAYGVYRLAQAVTGNDRTALLAVALTAAAPMAIVYNLAYAEVLLCALTAWALVGLVEQRWLLAGWCTLLAGGTRPAAIVLVVVVTAVAARQAYRCRDFHAACCTVLAPAGLAAYLLSVARMTGSVTGYADIQRAGWGLRVDGGRDLVGLMWVTLNTDRSTWATLVVASVLVALVALVLTARQLPWILWAYAALLVALAATTSGVLYDRPRELLPAFVLLIPLAAWLARQRLLVTITITTVFALFGAWISGFSLTAWPSAI